MTDRELMQQALEALDSDNPEIQLRAAIALRERLAQPEQEFGFAESLAHRALPRREWAGLTEDEINEADDATLSIDDFARAIEAKLREKNA